MKKVAVFFDAPKLEAYPFDKEEYRTAYYELAQLVTDRGGMFFIVREQTTFLGKNTFARGWQFEHGDFVAVEEPFTVDLIYDKGYFKTDNLSNVLNDRRFDVLCTDKWKTYTMFPDFCPQTFLALSTEDRDKILNTLGEQRVVAKPIDGQEGQGVHIGPASEVKEFITQFPYLIQEFIDTSGGIPGVVEGHHDFRIIVIAGEPMVSYVRTPPPGKLAANVALGGREIMVEVERIPAEALALFHTIDASFTEFSKRVYSVDMGLDRNGQWKIIELNSKPGLTPMRGGEPYVRFLNTLADILVA